MPLELHTDANLIQDLEQLRDLWNPPPSPYLTDPVSWVHKEARMETWSGQREILRSVAHNRYTAVRSGYGIGKSHIASAVICWWLAVKSDPFVVTSAPTSHQVRTILWRYVRRMKQALGLPGKISEGQVPEWKIAGELVAFGRKPADYLDAETAKAAFQGIHALNVLVVLDEGAGIPEWLVDACEGLVTNENSRVLIIGNPGDPTSSFAKMFKPASGYTTLKYSVFDTPNFTGEKISRRLSEVLVSKIWEQERLKRWGPQSPLYIAKVLAEFPEVTDDTIFPPSIINKGILCDRSDVASGNKGRYGFDVARLGPDESVVYHNRRGYVRLVKKWAKKETMQSVGEYRRLTRERPELAPPGVIDVVGLGSGVYDRLKELNYSMIPFNGGEKAYNFEKYKNRRSEAYWEAREAMDEGLVDIEELDEDLQAELMEIRYKETSTGQIQVEPKEDIIARLGRSPDRADAFVMSLQMQADPARFYSANKHAEADYSSPPASNEYSSDEPDDLVSDLQDVKF